MRRNLDKRHGARNLKTLIPGDTVWIPERNAGGTVERQTPSHVVQTEEGTLRRNCRDLILMPNTADTQVNAHAKSSLTEQSYQENCPAVGTRTRSGRISKPPEGFM